MLKLMYVQKDLYPSFNSYQNSGIVIKSEILHRGQMNCKTNVNDKWKSSHLTLRHVTLLDNNKKLYLESTEHRHEIKTQFLIDMDNVDQIDLNNKKNIIILKRSESNEICLINSNEKSTLKEWLKILCKFCGFQESYEIKVSKHQKTLRELFNQTLKVSNRVHKIPNLIHKQSQCLIAGTSNSNVNIELNEIQVAGLISNQVGSFKDHPIFRQFLKQFEDCQKLDYLCLEQCQSGVDESKSHLIDIEQIFTSRSFNDLSDESNRNKLTYVPLEVLNSREEVDGIDSESQSSGDSSSLKDYQKIYDSQVNKSFTLSKKSNFSNVSCVMHQNYVPYTYLDQKRTEALKNTIKGLKKQF